MTPPPPSDHHRTRSPAQRFPARGPLVLGLLTLAALVLGFGWWAQGTAIAGAIVATGQVEVDRNRQVVQHPDGGVVAEIRVREGDKVARDALLVRLDGAALDSELARVEGQLFETLARIARLEAERDGADEIAFKDELMAAADARPAIGQLVTGQQTLFDARRASQERARALLAAQRGQIESRIAGIDAQLAALATQIALIAGETGTQDALLARGLAPSARVLDLKRAGADLEGRRGEILAARAQAGERVAEIDIEIGQLADARREEAATQLRDLGAQAFDLAERRRALRDRIGRLDVRAPVAGVVLGMRVFAERAVIVAAEPILFIVPQDRPLVIAARIAPAGIGEIHVGQPASLRFSAFDRHESPELRGEVTHISADAFTDERSGAFYRAEIRLDPDELARLPPGLALMPGMPVEAFIQTGTRTPLAYLLQPLGNYFSRAFRES